MDYINFVIPGDPVTKSNFCMVNNVGKKIMPKNTGNKNIDKYSEYEDLIIDCIKDKAVQDYFKNGIIAVLIIYYRYLKKHPDTNNMPKSIFDGIEKSGLIINDRQVKNIILIEKYDKENPRVEIFLYDETKYKLIFNVNKKVLSNIDLSNNNIKNNTSAIKDNTKYIECDYCKKKVLKKEAKKITGSEKYICLKCIFHA